MATVKYKAVASYTDRLYFTRMVEVDSALYPSEEEQMDYVEDYLYEDFYEHNFEGWDEDGGDVIDCFTIETIEKI